MIPVSNLDAAMLYAETPEMPMHTMGVLILERQELPAKPDQGSLSSFELTRRVFSERIHRIPPFRRRVVQGPLQVGDPHWIEDPEFDLDRHLVHATLPSPGTMRELCDLVGSFASTCLSRDQPLWKAILVEGLEGGQLDSVTGACRRAPQTLLPVLLDLAGKLDTPFAVRIGVGAVLEDLATDDLLSGLTGPISRLTASPQPQVRADAAHFLGLTGSPDARSELERLASSDEDPEVREIALESLAELDPEQA